jgi:hypothetical protein
MVNSLFIGKRNPGQSGAAKGALAGLRLNSFFELSI